VDAKIKEVGLPCKMRDIYNPLKISVKDLRDCINGKYLFVNSDIKKKIA
jgi:hypothetical protein